MGLVSMEMMPITIDVQRARVRAVDIHASPVFSKYSPCKNQIIPAIDAVATAKWSG